MTKGIYYTLLSYLQCMFISHVFFFGSRHSCFAFNLGTLLLAAYTTLFQTSFCMMAPAGRTGRRTRCQMGVLRGLVEQRRPGREMARRTTAMKRNNSWSLLLFSGLLWRKRISFEKNVNCMCAFEGNSLFIYYLILWWGGWETKYRERFLCVRVRVCVGIMVPPPKYALF